MQATPNRTSVKAGNDSHVDSWHQPVIPNPVARPWRTAVRDLLFLSGAIE
jgi:hypothetical protein